MTGRRHVRAGVVGLVACVLVVVATMNVARLPFLGGGGHELRAEFADTTGLEEGDRVEIAGVTVGRVTHLAMGRARIVVTFTVDSAAHLGDRTTARIKVTNLLGSKYLEVEPAGGGTVGGLIPLARTRPAYDLTSAIGDLTDTVEPIDVGQLERALQAVAGTFRGSGPDVRASLRGLSQISRTIAARDDQVTSLLRRSEQLTGSLDGSRQDVAALVHESALLLGELDRRSAAIHGLIVHTRELSDQLHGLVQDNEAQIRPALAALGRVTQQLQDRQRALRATVRGVAEFARVFVNTIGSGPWFDSYIGNGPDSLKIEDPK